ncbi:hypothetical protein RI367_006259 [Sorochytrium milnesiophthora]
MHGQCHFIPLALLLALLISQAVSWLGPPDLDADTTVAPDSDAFESLFDKLVASYLDGDGSIPKVSHAKARARVKRNDTSSAETGLQVSNRASSIAWEPHVSSEQPPAVLDHAGAAIDRHLRRFDARQAQARAVAFQRRAFELQMQQHVQLQRMMAGVFALSTLFSDDEYDYLETSKHSRMDAGQDVRFLFSSTLSNYGHSKNHCAQLSRG